MKEIEKTELAWNLGTQENQKQFSEQNNEGPPRLGKVRFFFNWEGGDTNIISGTQNGLIIFDP